jgi:hypothetical protein
MVPDHHVLNWTREGRGRTAATVSGGKYLDGAAVLQQPGPWRWTPVSGSIVVLASWRVLTREYWRTRWWCPADPHTWAWFGRFPARAGSGGALTRATCLLRRVPDAVVVDLGPRWSPAQVPSTACATAAYPVRLLVDRSRGGSRPRSLPHVWAVAWCRSPVAALLSAVYYRGQQRLVGGRWAGPSWPERKAQVLGRHTRPRPRPSDLRRSSPGSGRTSANEAPMRTYPEPRPPHSCAADGTSILGVDAGRWHCGRTADDHSRARNGTGAGTPAGPARTRDAPAATGERERRVAPRGEAVAADVVAGAAHDGAVGRGRSTQSFRRAQPTPTAPTVHPADQQTASDAAGGRRVTRPGATSA